LVFQSRLCLALAYAGFFLNRFSIATVQGFALALSDVDDARQR
jgi:hypothetical protein